MNIKRLNLNVTGKAHAELLELSKKTNRSMSEIIRLGVGLAKIALEQKDKGNSIMVTNSKGDPIKEIII